MSIRFLTAIPLAVVITSAAIAAGGSLDYNGDGKISREEFRNEAAKTAFGADKNKNGFIDEDEYKLDEKQRKDVDTNSDGKVSVEEFQGGQMSGFDALDKNSDGFLDAAEMRG